MPPAKHRTPAVPAKVKVALDLLFNDPTVDLAAAAAAVDMPTNRLRDQLKLPHVRQHVARERAAFLDALCAGNIASLKSIRDTSKNAMARVAAIRQAEIMKQDIDGPAHGLLQQHHAPGLVVVIQSAVDGRIMQTIPPLPPAPMIEHEPERAAELEP